MAIEKSRKYSGGCLCGALRYEADGPPKAEGHCYCADCRKASGSGFIPFMVFPGGAIRFHGTSAKYTSKSARGTDAVRNSCPICASLVFGGEVGKDAMFTIYAGSLDDPSLFRPTSAIFTRGRPDWAVIPEGLKAYDRGY